jgi:glycolate oxidase FAD binding subunit
MTAAASDASALTATRIAQQFGAENVVASAAELAGYEVDGVRPAAAVFAKSADVIAEILRFAATEKLAVIPCGGRTKLGIGMPPSRYDIALDVSRMNRVLAYEPRDLTLGVEPGVRFETLREMLSTESQWLWLPVMPPFAKRATIGGMLAADSTSTLRHAYGGLRDFTLGLEFVTGFGAAAKSGGRVVKNVSGYDAHKLLIGSLGTLAVITRANFKMFPFPPERKVFVVDFASSAAAMKFCRAIGRSALEPRFVEMISPQAAKIMTADVASGLALRSDRWSVAIGLAASERVVARHSREIAALSAEHKANEMVTLGGEDQLPLLDQIREFPALILATNPGAAIFRIAALPATMAALAERLSAIGVERSFSDATSCAMMLRPHGLIYFALLPGDIGTAEIAKLAGAAEKVFRAAGELGAKARIEFAPVELKRAINVWGAARPDFELMRRVKKVFDPENVLSPGRFAPGG